MPKNTTRIIAIAAGVATVALGVLFIPRTPSLNTETTGDDDLIAQVREHARGKGTFNHLSVAVIEGNKDRRAYFGADGSTEYEIGSVTKTFTGSLLAIAIERGEVTLGTRLDELLDLTGTDAGAVTLGELATHTSGIPRLALTPGSVLPLIGGIITAGDPYGQTRDDLVEAARTTGVGAKTFEYSNFGFALLGHALAAAADTDWQTLVTERVITPLHLERTYAPITKGDLRDGAPTGFTGSGRPSAAWTLSGNAPAGSIRSTADDMVTYVAAQCDGTAPGVAATEGTTDVGGGELIGMAWFTRDGITWHNGGTGGFSSFVSCNKETGRVVVVLSDTANSDAIDALGGALSREK